MLCISQSEPVCFFLLELRTQRDPLLACIDYGPYFMGVHQGRRTP